MPRVLFAVLLRRNSWQVSWNPLKLTRYSRFTEVAKMHCWGMRSGPYRFLRFQYRSPAKRGGLQRAREIVRERFSGMTIFSEPANIILISMQSLRSERRHRAAKRRHGRAARWL